ncbi:hypothetical protein ES703_83358 [subsurface metagenome]
MDVWRDKILHRALGDADLILPALEDDLALERISRWAGKLGIPCAFDIDAYRVSSSKLDSNRLFQELDLPIPRLWPDSKFPVILKPDRGSGSRGIHICKDVTDLSKRFAVPGMMDGLIVQEFVKGNSYSLEVFGFPGTYRPLQVTDLYMDASFDCKRVAAPTELNSAMKEEFANMSVSIAEALGLKGLMDVEVIKNEGCLKILEIDARLPSQTPITVFWSTGLNMVELLGKLFTNPCGKLSFPELITDIALGVVIEHIIVTEKRLEITGEHIWAGQESLRLHEDFFGADEAITNYSPDRRQWAASRPGLCPWIVDRARLKASVKLCNKLYSIQDVKLSLLHIPMFPGLQRRLKKRATLFFWRTITVLSPSLEMQAGLLITPYPL